MNCRCIALLRCMNPTRDCSSTTSRRWWNFSGISQASWFRHRLSSTPRGSILCSTTCRCEDWKSRSRLFASISIVFAAATTSLVCNNCCLPVSSVITARGSNGSIAFTLHQKVSDHDNSWTAALSLTRTLLNIKVIGHKSRSHGFLCASCLHDAAWTSSSRFTKCHSLDGATFWPPTEVTAATHGHYSALSTAWRSCYLYLFSIIFLFFYRYLFEILLHVFCIHLDCLCWRHIVTGMWWQTVAFLGLLLLSLLSNFEELLMRLLWHISSVFLKRRWFVCDVVLNKCVLIDWWIDCLDQSISWLMDGWIDWLVICLIFLLDIL